MSDYAKTQAGSLRRRAFLSACAAAALPAAAVLRADPRRPNIVFILADDLGYGDLGCYNRDSRVPTPNLDRLARQGMRFTDAHSPSAVCTPTRYGVLTGRYCWRSSLKQGVLWGYSPALIEDGRMTVASMLKARGYHTAGIGKWHLGLGRAEKADYSKPLHPCPNDYGFDYYFGIPASLDMEPYVWLENDHVLAPPTEQIAEMKQQRGIFWRGGPVAPGFRHEDVLPTLTAKAVGFLRDHARQSPSDPFFLYLPLTAPHTPWLPTAPFQGKAKAGPYGDFVAMVDDSVGQVLEILERYNLDRNTLVILTSDNGAHWLPEEIERWQHRANGPLRGQKADTWEGGHRVPFIARWPGRIQPGSLCHETICLTDLMATAAEISGAKLPPDAGEDSFSLLPALLGQSAGKALREATVHHSLMGIFSIRQGPWKLILGRGSGGFSEPQIIHPKPGEPEGELYNLAEDPAEKNNLFQKMPEVVARLKALLEKYKTEGRSRPL